MRLFLLPLLVLLTAAPADAQRRRHVPFAEKGDVALLVAVEGLANPRLVPALGGIGVRYRLAGETALGMSVGFSTSESDREQDRDDRESQDDETSQGGMSASVWLEQHLGSRRRTISPLVGAGIRYRFQQYESERVETVLPCNDPEACALVERVQRYETSENGVGGAVFLGAEVRIVRGITIGAVYGIGAEYTRKDDEREDTLDDTEQRLTFTEEGVRVGTGLSSFSLSVYF